MNSAEADIKDIVGAIAKSYGTEPDIIRIGEHEQIDRDAVDTITDDLRSLIFAGYYDRRRLKPELVEYYVGETVERIFVSLSRQIGKALRIGDAASPGLDEGSEALAEQKALSFLKEIPAIRAVLATDVEASFDGDPAARSKEEIILSYPGIHAISVYRLAHELYLRDIPLIPRMMTERAHSLTGIDINPGAKIGHHFFLDHGTGIVVGETCIIGNFVKIYQGVTLGAMSTRGGQLLTGVKRHPTIEDHVTIYSGASILGGATVIGEGVVVGSNSFITKSIPEKTRVSIREPDLLYKSDDKDRDAFWVYTI
ncbi:MAG: serine acetyltransferase [Clostridiales Family XIII bacterium]|jgi:serine O-acetyltransferase|nr:serine acetyltransferase [Clostridiales Family XIII bacterium]